MMGLGVKPFVGYKLNEAWGVQADLAASYLCDDAKGGVIALAGTVRYAPGVSRQLGIYGGIGGQVAKVSNESANWRWFFPIAIAYEFSHGFHWGIQIKSGNPLRGLEGILGNITNSMSNSANIFIGYNLAKLF